MTMETNVNYTLVGIFVVALVTAIILAIIWLSSGFSLDQYSIYKIYMEESVTGLSVDGPVEFNGVNVGTVNSIEINHKNPELVELLLSVKNTTPITKGTFATLNSKGITGITYIALKDKSTDLRPLVAEPGQPYPVIPTAPSLFLRLDTALKQLSTNLRKVSESIQSVLDPENQRMIKDTLRSLQEITGNLATNSDKFNRILENTAKASQQFTPLMQSTVQAMHMLEAQTLPATYRLMNNLDNITRTVAEVALELKQNPSVLIRGAEPAPLGPGEKK